MMPNHSENWRHLKSILTGYSTANTTVELYSHMDHVHAKALSIFLANATLSTPKLNRVTVENIIYGKQSWPNTVTADNFDAINLPLSLLEENGLIAFYADWCTVHCQTMQNLDNVDPSLIDLVKVIEHLKDICYGRNGYTQPHYTCPEDELKGLISQNFFGASVVDILPELFLEDSQFRLPPGNQNFSSLISTNLWKTLHKSLEPQEAFAKWILCQRVNCDWAMPVIFNYLDDQERDEFNNQLILYLSQDNGLEYSMETMEKQQINSDRFLAIISPIQTRSNITIDGEGNRYSAYEEIALERATLKTLNAAYPKYDTDYLDDLHLVRQCQKVRYGREPEFFYTWMLCSTIENNIRIEGDALLHSNLVEALYELAVNRPVLKHILINLLPRYEKPAYKIFLLSRPATCEISMFYLTQKSITNSRCNSHLFSQNFEKSYQQLVFHEYLRAIKDQPDSGNRLLKVVDFLGDRCSLHSIDYSQSSEYKLLLLFLESLGNQHIIPLAQALDKYFNIPEKNPNQKRSQHYWYAVGFWLIEHLWDTGIDISGEFSLSLKKTLLNYYRTDFEENIAGRRRDLKPNDFFSSLPWHKLIAQEGVSPLLAISQDCCNWQKILTYSNNNNYAAASAIRHYLQVLMCAGRPRRISDGWERIANRVTKIILTVGFGNRDHAIYLFDGAFYETQYDLWAPFCSYTNLFRDSLFDDFIDDCLPTIPLNKLFVLLESCTVIAHIQKLEKEIATRHSPETEDMGLSGIEQAFISACDSRHNFLATKLISRAKEVLRQDYFERTNNPYIVRARKVWLSYEYKLQLLNLLEELNSNPEKFDKAAHQLPLPHMRGDNTLQKGDRTHYQECERFRRYIIAAAYGETDPEKCVRIMEALYAETKNSMHSFMLFKGRVALYGINNDRAELRNGLSKFLMSVSDTEPTKMPTLWVSTILDAYRQLHDEKKIDDFWIKLNVDQQARVEILRPYCLALISRDEAIIAQQIVNRCIDLNQKTVDGLKINDLIDELCKALPIDLSLSQYVKVVNENSQRTARQLATDYSLIVSKDFKDYVAITGHGLLPHEYLKNAVVEVASELALRKKNLHIHSVNTTEKMDIRITNEDLINDWFTSLFDKRMAEARIGLRDQKRGGQSASGKRPGEIDGFITDAKNNRIAIFEAFRLSSNNTNVISDHLDKISGYDNESLSPVFIVAYCDVANFSALVSNYAEFIQKRDYTGFTVDLDKNPRIEQLEYTNHLWLCMERRSRSHKEVIFYHLLLDMRFQ